MRMIFFLMTVLFITPALVKADNDSLYYTANKFYQEGKYEEAIATYDSIINAGFESANLYYNLGNSFFRSNKLGKARLYYEKALKLEPADEDSRANLRYLNELLSDRFEEVPVIFYKTWIKSVLLSLSSNQWAYCSMFSFILAVLSIVIYLLLQQRFLRITGFYSSIVFLILSLSTLTASWKQHKLIQNPETAVVTELSVNVKSAPRETGNGLFILHEGAKVWLEDKTGGWQEIRLSDGRTGWVPEESLETI
jgi:tetratricopeptide (TPR) repeat protein